MYNMYVQGVLRHNVNPWRHIIFPLRGKLPPPPEKWLEFIYSPLAVTIVNPIFKKEQNRQTLTPCPIGETFIWY